MSQENVEVFKRGVEALNARDVDAFLDAFDPEAEWRPVFQVMLGGESTVYRGHQRIREALEEVFDVFPEINAEHWEFRDHGDQLVAIGRLRARGNQSGAGNESPLVCVAEFKDAKVLRLRDYLGLEAALEASGLSDVASDEKLSA